ncbi:hypothetical protein ACS0TY_006649 [Phlomoides rotata]
MKNVSNMKQTTLQETGTLGEVEDVPELTENNDQNNIEEDGPKYQKKCVIVKEKKQLNNGHTGEKASINEKK